MRGRGRAGAGSGRRGAQVRGPSRDPGAALGGEAWLRGSSGGSGGALSLPSHSATNGNFREHLLCAPAGTTGAGHPDSVSVSSGGNSGLIGVGRDK